MHVSRLTKFNDGYILNLNKGFNFFQHSWINFLGGFVDKGFLEHLDNIFLEGISEHGSNYLYQGFKGTINFPSWALEMCFESVRYKEFPDKPSRFQGAFAWRDLKDAQGFIRSIGHNNAMWDIYAVEPLDAVAFLDMNLITGDTRYFGGSVCNAMAYWNGDTPEVQGYSPTIEVLMKCPVKVLGKVPHSW